MNLKLIAYYKGNDAFLSAYMCCWVKHRFMLLPLHCPLLDTDATCQILPPSSKQTLLHDIFIPVQILGINIKDNLPSIL